MPEPTQIAFTYKEIVTALLKQQDIHEGTWGIFMRFGIQGSNMGPNPAELLPTAIIPIMQIGIQKFDQENNLAVDASKVNPKVETEAPRPEGPSRRTKAR